MNEGSILINCGCGKRFPVNLAKHPGRRSVFCPFCRMDHLTPHKKGWRPRAKWHKDKHVSKPFTAQDIQRILRGILGFRTIKPPSFPTIEEKKEKAE